MHDGEFVLVPELLQRREKRRYAVLAVEPQYLAKVDEVLNPQPRAAPPDVGPTPVKPPPPGPPAPPDPDGKIIRALSEPIHRTGG